MHKNKTINNAHTHIYIHSHTQYFKIQNWIKNLQLRASCFQSIDVLVFNRSEIRIKAMKLSLEFLYCFYCYSKNRLIGLMSRVFTNGPGDLASIPDCVIPKTLKMVLDPSLPNTQQYKVHIKGKVEQSRESSSALPYISV